MSEWRTIDSAPKDGTHVIIYCPTWRIRGDRDWTIEERVGEAYFLHKELCVNDEYGWYWVGEEHVDSAEERIAKSPTHWQPLPPPPTP